MKLERLALRRLAPAAVFACMPGLRAQTPQATSEALAKLVPKGTLVYVQTPSLEQLGAAIRRAATPFSAAQAESMVLDELLGSMEFPGLLKQVDHGKPVGVCIVFPAGEGAEPGRVFLVPTLSVEEYVSSVKETSRSVTRGEGGYVAVALDAEAQPGTGNASIATGLPAGDLVARVDVVGLVERFRAQIDAGLGEMESGMEAGSAAMPMGFDTRPMMKMYVDGVRDVVNSGETLDLTARLEGTRLEIGGALAMKEKSTLAGFGSKEKTDGPALARFLDSSAALSMVMGMDTIAMTKRFQPFLDAVVAMYPEPFRTTIKPVLSGTGDLAAQLGSAMCVSGDIGSTGFRAAYYLKPRDAAKLVALYKSMLHSMPGLTIEESKDGELDGVPVTRMRMHIDAKTMFDAEKKTDPADENQAMAQTQLKAMMDKLYGKDGIALTIATKGDVAALVIGGDEAYLHASLARMATGGSPPAEVARGLAQVGGLNPFFVTSYNLGRVMAGMTEMMGDILPMSMSFANLSASISAWGGVDGRVWRGATSCDLVEIAAASKAMSETEMGRTRRTVAMVGIRAIVQALDEYAVNNGGKFPDSLEVLVTPDANGETYLRRTTLPVDPWGRDFMYESPSAGRPRPHVWSYGRDGAAGGEGEDADIDEKTTG